MTTPDRVYVLVAVDKDAVTNAAPFVSAALCSFLFVDQYAVADVTDLLATDGANVANEVESHELQARGFSRGWETLADRAKERLS